MSEAAPVIRLLVVDDHALLRDGIAALTAGQADMEVVADGGNGREAMQQFRAHRPDITIMDLLCGVSRCLQPTRQRGRQLGIDEEPH